MCISTVVIDNEHLRLGSLALRAEEERKTDDSAKKKKKTNKKQPTNADSRGIFALGIS